jgi:lipopolysaccharide biosynthesis glycosyltransferase
LHANYFRFYLPLFLSENYGAQSYLYLDSDTAFINDGLLALFDQESLPLVSAGAQRKEICWFSKMVNLQDERVKRLDIKPDALCITASVMLINIKEWLGNNVTHSIESWLASNEAEKLYLCLH